MIYHGGFEKWQKLKSSILFKTLTKAISQSIGIDVNHTLILSLTCSNLYRDGRLKNKPIQIRLAVLRRESTNPGEREQMQLSSFYIYIKIPKYCVQSFCK